MPEPQIIKVNDTTLQFGRRLESVSGPINDYHVIGSRVLVFYDSPEDGMADRESFRTFPVRKTAESIFTLLYGSVQRGVRISILADTTDGFITPSGARVETPSQPRMLCQIKQGCAVLMPDLRDGNVMLYGNDGRVVWRIGSNPFVRTGVYDVVTSRWGRLYLTQDRPISKKYEVDPDSGKILTQEPL